MHGWTHRTLPVIQSSPTGCSPRPPTGIRWSRPVCKGNGHWYPNSFWKMKHISTRSGYQSRPPFHWACIGRLTLGHSWWDWLKLGTPLLWIYVYTWYLDNIRVPPRVPKPKHIEKYVYHQHVVGIDMCMHTFTKKRKSRCMGQIHIIWMSPPVLFMIEHIESCCFVLGQWHQSGQVPLACKVFDPLVILARGYGRLNLSMFLVWQRFHQSPTGSFMLQLSKHRLIFRRNPKGDHGSLEFPPAPGLSDLKSPNEQQDHQHKFLDWEIGKLEMIDMEIQSDAKRWDPISYNI